MSGEHTQAQLGAVPDDEALIYAPDEPDAPAQNGWKLLIVDDEPEVHRVTELALDDFRFQERPLELIHVYSGAEAIRTLDAQPDIALVLLDVVMETEDAGFKVIRHIRDTLQNRVIRIILRTGQPGQAPARSVIRNYEINDYHSKAELTVDRMYIAIYTALAMYEHLSTRLQHAQRLEKAYAEIEQLVHIASHDLQEPLRSVSALGQRLLSVNREQLDADGRQCLDYLLRGVERMSGLAKGLREHAQLGRPGPSEKLSMNALFDECCEGLSHEIQTSGATVERDELPMVQGQKAKLSALIQHLLDNALRYRRPDQPPRIHLSATPQAEGTLFCLKDNGLGIPEDQREEVFKVFYRLQNPHQAGSTGIGLAHCRKIVEQHGGAIWAQAADTGGSVLCFTLPRADS